MDPVASLDVEAIRWMQYLYFAGGIAVILLGAVGTILVILGILQAKFLKPYRNRYPYEEFKNFDEFVFKKPSHAENTTFTEAYPSTSEKSGNAKSDDLPILTWENAKDFIPNLTVKETQTIDEMLETEHEVSSKNSPDSQS